MVLHPINNVNQIHLERIVQLIFLGEDIHVNAREQHRLTHPITHTALELDVWLPTLQLAFEFQDPYHFRTAWNCLLPLHEVQQRDKVKTFVVQQSRITLIAVPCWWDGAPESLTATVQFHRPDLLSATNCFSAPILFNPPKLFFENYDARIPEIGELMIATFPSSNFEEKVSYTNACTWWAGEKYDGVRCCSFGTPSQIFSRVGVPFNFPTKIAESIGRFFLDGEIWFGRNAFSQAQAVVTSPNSINWTHFRTIAFDRPSGDPMTMEERYKWLTLDIPPCHPFVLITMRQLCTTAGQVACMLDEVLSERGEGVIIQKSCSFYVSGKSPYLFKIKTSSGDMDALVASTSPYILQLATGQRVEVTKQQVAEDIVLKKGDIVTFSYDYHQRTKLMDNIMVRKKLTGVSWDDILLTGGAHLHEATIKHDSFSAQHSTIETTRDKWRAIDFRRQFFIHYANLRQFDPLVASNWYSETATSIGQVQGGKPIMRLYNDLESALAHVFPNVRWDSAQFNSLQKLRIEEETKSFRPHRTAATLPNIYASNHKLFFDEFAQENAFDPLDPDKWHSVPYSLLKSKKGAAQILEHYNGSLFKALITQYPAIGLKSFKRRKFEEIAKKLNFDPLIVENWYYLRQDGVLREKGGAALLRPYRNKISTALRFNFPEMVIDDKKFLLTRNEYWKETGNQKRFFIDFARSKQFDPLVAGNWHSLKDKHIARKKGIARFLKAYYNGDFRNALAKLFSLQFDYSKTKLCNNV